MALWGGLWPGAVRKHAYAEGNQTLILLPLWERLHWREYTWQQCDIDSPIPGLLMR
jgi:hypothetical protein